MPFDAGPSAALTALDRSRCPSVPPGWNLIPDPTHKTRIIVRNRGLKWVLSASATDFQSAAAPRQTVASGEKAAVIRYKQAADGKRGALGHGSCDDCRQAALARRLFVLGLRQVADELDDGAAEFCRADLHETGDQRQPVGASQKFRDVGERRRVGGSAFRAQTPGTPSKKNSTGTWRMCAICCNRLAPTRLTPFSYFWICWKVRSRPFGQVGLRHAEHQAAHPYTRADIFVSRIGSFDRHHSAIPLAGASRILTGRQTPPRRSAKVAPTSQAYRRGVRSTGTIGG